MRPAPYTEDALVQQTTAQYLEEELGWESVYAFNHEKFGSDGTLGRDGEDEVVLTRYLRNALQEYNPALPDEAYDNAVREIVQVNVGHSTLQTNFEKYDLLRNGVKVHYRKPSGGTETRTLRVFDFDDPVNNHFLAVRELWIKGPLYRRRADIVGFVNGLPLLFIELKNVHKNIQRAYVDNLADYKDTIPHVFHHNAFVVLGNGIDARVGSYSAPFGFFREWKRLDEDEPGVVNMETLLKGVCIKSNFLDLFENFVLFDNSGEKLIKVVAQNQQYLGVNRAMRSIENQESSGRLGVYWHTQGAGKSYSMVFLSRKVHRKLGGNYTFLVLCDRDDLEEQIYRTYAGCGVVGENEDARTSSGKHLKRLLGLHKPYVFSLIQKFNEDVLPNEPYSDRDDVIVFVDEAHRTQYGRLAINRRNALPNARYMAFTGTPLMKEDQITSRVFGDYVSSYGFQRAVEDGATVPLFYDSRGEKLGVATKKLNEKIAEKLEEFETSDIDVEQRLESDLRRDYHIITAPDRLDAIARDFVKHYSNAWESGKAMFVTIDKITAVRMHVLISKYWTEYFDQLQTRIASAIDEEARLELERQYAWMKETQIAVVISEEQGEVDKFRKWDLDIEPHRRLIKEGFSARKGERIQVEDAFKKADHPFRVAIVCAMWLTGFDVQSLSILYLDKPLKAHALMQAIARPNRVYEGKNNGLIVDYCGILKNLRRALATFAGHTGQNEGDKEEIDPARPDEVLLEELAESIDFVRSFLAAENFRLEEIAEKRGFYRNAAIMAAKEIINENDETRKRFEIMARGVFQKYKACSNLADINAYREPHDAIAIVYKSLQMDRDRADISQIIKELHEIVGQNIIVSEAKGTRDSGLPYNISAIDFERLRQEFAQGAQKHTQVQNLKIAIEKRLATMLASNPLRTDFQRHYEDLVEEYNQEKDRVTIERTFEALLRLVADLDEEQERALREGLDEPSLAVFDLLMKDDLTPTDIKRIKSVSVELNARLEPELARIRDWQTKEATRDFVKQTIFDFLYTDKTGLPASYTVDEINLKAQAVFAHFLYLQRYGMTAAVS